MTTDDKITRLLQSADAAAAPPQPPADLPNQVRLRSRKVAQSRRVYTSLATVAAIALVCSGLTFFRVRQPTVPLVNQPSADEIARLKSAAQSAALEADALEQSIAAHLRAERLNELIQQRDSLLVAASAPDPATSALDRAAGNAICQADFLFETLGDRLAAMDAYRLVVQQFPDTRWATLAQSNLVRLEMN